MRTCVIFNPTAKGDKARRFRSFLERIGAQCTLMQTTAPGDASRLAADAVKQGFEIVVAAGGDGTLNEVLNGIGDAPDGFSRASLAILPVGTVNVFARELGIPLQLDAAWEIIRRGRQISIDLPSVEFSRNGRVVRRYFAQLAGAGLDARAIELVNWPLKKRIGPLAYVVAGLNALRSSPCRISVSSSGETLCGELVLIGNGRLYGGNFRVFPAADLNDGLLEISVFPRANWLTLARCAPDLLLMQRLPISSTRNLQSASFTLTSPEPAALQLDGELVGHLPAKFSVHPAALKVICK